MAVSTEPASTGAVSMRELLEAGVHFGHQTRRWNPKMRRFIFAERGGIYIIDLTQTAERLDEAQQFLRNVAERGGTVLFVGTKKQAQDAVEGEAKRVGMPYVNHRWLGGLLTNWRTMADRIDRLHEMRRLRPHSASGTTTGIGWSGAALARSSRIGSTFPGPFCRSWRSLTIVLSAARCAVARARSAATGTTGSATRSTRPRRARP